MPFTPLRCEEIVLRALLKKGWIDDETKRIKADAFILDPAKDHDGLSVNIQARTDIAVWLGSFNTSYGADSLHTGRVNALGLVVGQTAADVLEHPEHAVITGIPSSEDDTARAESLASALAHICRPVERTPRKRQKRR